MDWSNVTVGEMVDAMREVEWNAPPKHPREFFQKFTQPKNMAKWKSRLKCNLYYYRTNYFIIICVTLGLAFAFRPLSLVIVALLLLAVLCQVGRAGCVSLLGAPEAYSQVLRNIPCRSTASRS